MKAQWQLIDTETGQALACLGDPFELDLKKLAKDFVTTLMSERIKGVSSEEDQEGALNAGKDKKG